MKYTKEELIKHEGKKIRIIIDNCIIDDAVLTYRDYNNSSDKYFFICNNVLDGGHTWFNKCGYPYAWAFHESNKGIINKIELL